LRNEAVLRFDGDFSAMRKLSRSKSVDGKKHTYLSRFSRVGSLLSSSLLSLSGGMARYGLMGTSWKLMQKTCLDGIDRR